MIDIQKLREHTKELLPLLKSRYDIKKIEEVLRLDEKRRKAETSLNELLAERKRLSDKAKGDSPKLREMKVSIKKLSDTCAEVTQAFTAALRAIPNIPAADVPKGTSSKENIVIKKVGKQPTFSFTPKDYLSLAGSKERFRLDAAQRVSGTRFAYITGDAALLELALIQYAFATLVPKGFIPVFPPTIVKKEIMQAMGYLDQAGEREVFTLPEDDSVLVGTSEQSLGPLHANAVLDEHQLPLRYVAFSSCYRREAGSYGKDTKGILRLHQFEKIEMFSFTTPEQGDAEHAFLLAAQEELMQGLGLHYQVVQLCTGDLGHPSARTYDIETFLPGQNDGKGEYRETHSTSLCTDYQSRRLHIKTSNGQNGKKRLAYTLNGTAFAMQRMLIAILENNQNADGTFRMPPILKKYLPGL